MKLRSRARQTVFVVFTLLILEVGPVVRQASAASAQTMPKSSVESDQLVKSLFSLNLRLKKMVRERRKIERRKSDLESKGALLTDSIESLQGEIDQRRLLISGTLVGARRIKKESILSVLLQSESSASLDRKIRTLEMVRDHHLSSLRTYIVGRNRLRKDQDQLEVTRQNLLKEEGRLLEAEAQLQREYDDKKLLLTQARKAKSKIKARLKRIETKDAAFAEEAKQMSSVLDRPSLIEMRGRLKAPVRAPALHRYGSFLDRDLKVYLPHSGVFYAADEGDSIHAPAEGVVVARVEVPGLGESVIIDHGDHFASVFAGVADVHYNLGEKVTAGAVIGKAAFNSLYNTSGLYFELRHYSEPQNPRKWVQGDLPK